MGVEEACGEQEELITSFMAGFLKGRGRGQTFLGARRPRRQDFSTRPSNSGITASCTPNLSLLSARASCIIFPTLPLISSFVKMICGAAGIDISTGRSNMVIRDGIIHEFECKLECRCVGLFCICIVRIARRMGKRLFIKAICVRGTISTTRVGKEWKCFDLRSVLEPTVYLCRITLND